MYGMDTESRIRRQRGGTVRAHIPTGFGEELDEGSELSSEEQEVRDAVIADMAKKAKKRKPLFD